MNPNELVARIGSKLELISQHENLSMINSPHNINIWAPKKVDLSSPSLLNGQNPQSENQNNVLKSSFKSFDTGSHRMKSVSNKHRHA